MEAIQIERQASPSPFKFAHITHPEIVQSWSIGVMLFWILLGFLCGIFALSILCDYVWTGRMNPPSRQHRVVCRSCADGHSSVEILGRWIHQYQDRWISCPGLHHPQTEVADVIDGVASSPAGAVDWQSDELLPVMEQGGLL
jgi:hypothetical protein